MKKVIISCPGQKKPARVCDLIKDDSGIIYLKIKFPGTPTLNINLSQYLSQLC